MQRSEPAVPEDVLAALREAAASYDEFIDCCIAVVEEFRDKHGIELERRVISSAFGMMQARDKLDIALIAALAIERIAAKEKLDGGVPGSH